MITPVDLFASFGSAALAVVSWVAAGIAAAIGLYFALLGIRKGLAWFFAIVEERLANGIMIDHYERENLATVSAIGGFSEEFSRDLAGGMGLGMYNFARKSEANRSEFSPAELDYLWSRYGEDV